MKRNYPSSVIHVVEQNPAQATFGFGVVFSERALGFLEDADAESFQDIERSLQTWDDQAIVHRDQKVQIDGLAFSGIARLKLLQILQVHCRRRGVEVHFERRVTDLHAFRTDYDIVIGADGVTPSCARPTRSTSSRPCRCSATNTSGTARSNSSTA